MWSLFDHSFQVYPGVRSAGKYILIEIDRSIQLDDNDEDVDDQVPLIKETSTEKDTKGKDQQTMLTVLLKRESVMKLQMFACETDITNN